MCLELLHPNISTIYESIVNELRATVRRKLRNTAMKYIRETQKQKIGFMCEFYNP